VRSVEGYETAKERTPQTQPDLKAGRRPGV
jgi:hypothetical protein